MQVMPISATSPVANQVQSQASTPGVVTAPGSGVTINVVENNYINLSNGTVEILNQFNPAPGDTFNLTENNYVQDASQQQAQQNNISGSGINNNDLTALTGASGNTLQQIEAEIGQYMLQTLYNVLYGNSQYNNASNLTTSTSSNSVSSTMSSSTAYATSLASTIV